MKEKAKLNDDIREPFVFLILPDGSRKPNTSRDEALQIADSHGMDLVFVSFSKDLNLPICRIFDYGKHQYEADKKKRKSKSNGIETKEVRISLNISDHDLQTKNRQVKKFLAKGNRVRYVLRLKKGRQRGMVKEAEMRMADALTDFTDVASWSPFKASDGQVSVLLNPIQ